jgi:hypothetical protein
VQFVHRVQFVFHFAFHGLWPTYFKMAFVKFEGCFAR